MFIDYGFGFANFIDNNSFNGIKSPIYRDSKFIKIHSPIWYIPTAVAPDEVFTFVSQYILPNSCNRYIVSNYGRMFDRFIYRYK